MITLKPLTYDLEQFFTELDIEITFMRLHNPDDEIEMVMNEKTYNRVCKYLAGDIKDFNNKPLVMTYKDIPIQIQNYMPDNVADVRIKTACNDFTTNRFMRGE